jgi:hypothetical protein
MAKIIKVKVRRVNEGVRVKYHYPPEYDATKIHVTGWESMTYAAKYTEVDARAAVGEDGYEYFLGVVSDVDAPVFLASPDIIEVTREAAALEGETWTEARSVIENEVIINTILDKVLASEVLSVEEIDAINPDSPVTGRKRLLNFTERLDAGIADKGA